jgi:hypothetical protein
MTTGMLVESWVVGGVRAVSTCLLTLTAVQGATLNPSGSGFACPSGPMKSSSSH